MGIYSKTKNPSNKMFDGFLVTAYKSTLEMKENTFLSNNKIKQKNNIKNTYSYCVTIASEFCSLLILIFTK